MFFQKERERGRTPPHRIGLVIFLLAHATRPRYCISQYISQEGNLDDNICFQVSVCMVVDTKAADFSCLCTNVAEGGG